MLDLLIIGAGPAGITAAYEAKKQNLDYVVVEEGLIGNTVYLYPVGLTVFSTTNELEIEPGGLKPAREKPTREELLSYYVRFVLDNELNVQTEEKVISVSSSASRSPSFSESSFGSSSVRSAHSVVPPFSAKPTTENTEDTEQKVETTEENEGTNIKENADSTKHSEGFVITTDKDIYYARNVLFAIGAMDYPRKLNVPGEDLPKVYDNFRETYPWVRKRALIVGGGNSAGEAALFLAEEGAETTLAIFRKDWENADPKQGCIKYWVKQPLEEELKKHCLNLFFLGEVIEITEDSVVLEDENGERDILPNDVVFVLIGADADLTMLKGLGVETAAGGKYGGEVPVYDERTFETNIPGIYVAGHFTSHRHIKGAIDAAKILVPKLAERLESTKPRGERELVERM